MVQECDFFLSQAKIACELKRIRRILAILALYLAGAKVEKYDLTFLEKNTLMEPEED